MSRTARPRIGHDGHMGRKLARVDTIDGKLVVTLAAVDKDGKRIKQVFDAPELVATAFGSSWRNKLDRGHQKFVPGDPIGSAGTWLHTP